MPPFPLCDELQAGNELARRPWVAEKVFGFTKRYALSGRIKRVRFIRPQKAFYGGVRPYEGSPA